MKGLILIFASLFSQIQALDYTQERSLVGLQSANSSENSEGFIIELAYNNEISTVYTAEAYFGSNRQGGSSSKFVVDTSTPFIAITEKTCDNCSTKHHGVGIFDPSKSQTFGYVTKPYETEQLTLGQFSFTGYWGTDYIGLQDQSGDVIEVQDFQFFLITHIDSISSGVDEANFSGVIGLGLPQSSNKQWPTTSFVHTLYQDGTIKSPEFSMYACFDDDGTPSVTIGASNSDYVKPDNESTNQTLAQVEGYQSVWAVGLTGLAFNDTSLELEDKHAAAVFDTQRDGYQLSQYLFGKYRDFIENYMNGTGIVWSDEDNYAWCNCQCANIADLMPPLSVEIGDYSYLIPSETFMSQTGGFFSKQCYLDIYELTEDDSNTNSISLILGNSFMRQITGSFNSESGSIVLAPSVTSVDGVSVDPIGPPPTPPSPSDDGGGGFGVWAIIGFIALGLFILFILVCFIHYCYDQYGTNEESEEGDREEREQNRKDFEHIKLNRSESSTNSSKSETYYEVKKFKKPIARSSFSNQTAPQKSMEFNNFNNNKRSEIEGISKIDIVSDHHPFSEISETSKANTCDEFGKLMFNKK